MNLNRFVERVTKLQLFGHGTKKLQVVLPDGTRLQPTNVWHDDTDIYIELAPAHDRRTSQKAA